jgi:choline dehydrogenase-like flavoprotein
MDLILYHTDITISRYGHVDLTRTTTNPEGSVFTVLNVLATPASRGAIRLSSADPLSPPLLDPTAFKNSIDAKLLYACARMTSTAIQHSSAVTRYGAVEYSVPDELKGDFSDDAMRTRLVKVAETINHGSGTCTMGSVVDTEYRVLGTRRLRVVDTSVIPFPMGSHYQAVVYAIAEQVILPCYLLDSVG